MPVGAKPVLEFLLKWLRRNDISQIYVTTGYLGHLIRSVCGDGSQWGLHIDYTSEREPLGTIGPLSLLRDELDETFLVINGDVLSDLSVAAFSSFHARHGGLVTVATTSRMTKLDFGVIEQDEGRITTFREKPTYSHLVSMGVYCMSPDVLKYIPEGVPFGFDDLVLCLLQRRIPTYAYQHDGFWLDIGRVEDFKRAQELSLDEQLPAFELIRENTARFANHRQDHELIRHEPGR